MVPTVAGILEFPLALIAIEENTDIRFGFIGDLARVVWLLVIAAIVTGLIAAAIRFVEA